MMPTTEIPVTTASAAIGPRRAITPNAITPMPISAPMSDVFDVDISTMKNAASATPAHNRFPVARYAARPIGAPSAMIPPIVFLCVQSPFQAPGCVAVATPIAGVATESTNEPAIITIQAMQNTSNSRRHS